MRHKFLYSRYTQAISTPATKYPSGIDKKSIFLPLLTVFYFVYFTAESPDVMKMYKRPLLLFGVMILLLKDVAAQCDSSYFRYTATLINDAIVFTDTNKIIGVGDNGFIIKSTDGGRNWKNIPTFQPYYLRAIYAPTDSILYTVGS